MNRALFSGVSGLKTHQTKMDVIGNNIANVNTYGYKSQRAVFSDIFYQTLTSASAGTTSRGGTNPSSVGYGTRLAAIQTNMSQSSMQSTGYGLDIAIAGEGFLQVMDADGSIFYTKAGILDYDSNGYLTDVNGNFVLGSTSADGTPDSKKIKLDNVGAIAATPASASMTINGISYKLSATQTNDSGNVSIAIGSSSSLPAGQLASASISTTGAITVQLDSDGTFASLAALNTAINAAITEANGGKAHAAGNFTLTSTDADAVFTANGGLTGAEICGTNFSKSQGTITGANIFGGNITVEGTSTSFVGNGTVNVGDFTATYHAATTTDPAYYEISMTVTPTTGAARTYTGKLEEGETADSLLLKNATDGDYVEISSPGYDALYAQGDTSDLNTTVDDGESIALTTAVLTVTPAADSSNLGLSASTFSLEGGTEGGAVTLDELTGIAIGADGTITATHPQKGTVTVGKISLANFANPSGLQLEGTNYYSETVNSGKPQLCNPGSDGSGELVSSTLEMSNVDLSAEFADMITTQRGFQANSRIITVSDTMLEELINLKR